ncbi:hypothetical protein BB560_002814 [Smittium megazygosporum]|uniref:MIP18 family-like domain-containing protein n=1 Tax=Smittium megazygosporum TaxID=133381 RepID=A0A2T9ZDV6_9FUNG|nr:hypothetical protein BB560_002814 [Smittium megazygosporum]
MINSSPVIYQKVAIERDDFAAFDDNFPDPVDNLEVYELIKDITDPEHPLTLEQLNITQPDHVFVDDKGNYIMIEFTPTIPHCSMSTLIGLCIRVALLPSINKQLNDKERVSAALENSNLLDVVNQCLASIY